MIKAIISDFDGTLADTFLPNLKAYQQAFREVELTLSEETYRKCFGLRFDDFMHIAGIRDTKLQQSIRESKRNCYPEYFSLLRPNLPLIHLITAFHQLGGKTALVSTAQKENLVKALDYIKVGDIFDVVLAGKDVSIGKPNPEIYLQTMHQLGISPREAIIFEDSPSGLAAAEASGSEYIKITL